MTDVVLGIDSSTQSCTVEVRDARRGTLLSTGRSAHPVTHPPVSEQHPDAWWAALVEAVAEALSGLEAHVIGVSVGAQCHGLVALDSDWGVIRPAKLWNDTTSAPQAQGLVEQRGTAWWADEIGIVPSAALTISKLMWLRDNEPDSFARLAHLCLPHDWLTWRLTGAHVTDRSDASGTGFYSAHLGSWRTDILAAEVASLDWDAVLPRVLCADEAAGTILPEVARELGIDEGAIVGAGGGDQHLAAQGIGLEPGDVAYSLGTSGVVFATTPEPVHDRSGGVDGVANVTGGYLPLICTLNCTKVTDTFARLLDVDHTELGRMALSAQVSEDRPVLAAYLDGERTPRLPLATGAIAGVTTSTTREQLALAAFEGVAMGLVRGERLLEACGVRIDGRTLLIGGGAKSAAYRQVIADLTGRDVITVDAPEATARGAAIQAAAVATGRSVVEITRSWGPAETSRTHPMHERSSAEARYARFADLQLTTTI